MLKKQILVLIGVVATAGIALAAPGAGRRGGGPDRAGRLSAWRQELGLSDDQVSQLQKLGSEGRRLAIRRHADVALARLNLREAMQKTPADEKLVQARTKELSDLRAANLRARVDARLAMREILTPEQLQKAKELRGERRRERREKRQSLGADAEPKR